VLNIAATLDDKYTLEQGRVYLSGIQALVRLLIVQAHRDRAAGLKTAGFVSGYRGSPLGGLDKELWKAAPYLDPLDIHFAPGVNEDLGATAVWGSQQVTLFGDATHEGVFGLWYGKNPGVDRSGDVFKHANAAGTSRYGGVLAIAGDDPACKSSTLPSQSDYAFMDAMIPVLNPASVQEILDLGVLGWELSRYSGCWVAMKVISENADASASVAVGPDRIQIARPQDFEPPPQGLHIRLADSALDQEFRLHRYKLYAALAFARANRLDRMVLDSPRPRLGIVTSGKAYLDVMQALKDLGIGENLAAEIGLRVYKVGMVWPLERDGVRQFAEGLEEVLVVEEKRAIIENQLKEQLYNWRSEIRPRVIGKFDESREWILPSSGELSPAQVAQVIAARIGRFYTSSKIEKRLAFLAAKESALSKPVASIARLPYFCSGCPHNTSTRVPAGSRAMAGIGCHYLAQFMDRDTSTFTHMGGEGATWIGQAPFTKTKHVFQNLGDGTYFHSGILAIRAAVAAGVNITYKILYNDAVAMTGGQPLDGLLTVEQLTHQLDGEGIDRIAVVSDEPGKYAARSAFPKGTTIHERHALDAVQRELREQPGVTALIYDQTCAAEKRRRRKRGRLADPPKRAFINEAVCEGCGDCGITSNCLSVVPVETQFGRKRAINQSSCNKDFSCVDGFCPSFVTVHGGSLRKGRATSGPMDFPELPEPRLAGIDGSYNILITGIGGTGIVTVSALLGMAAHLEAKGCSVLDQTGLAQKFGAVSSHIRISQDPEDLHSVRIPAGEAHLLLGCDQLVAASFDALAKLDPSMSHAVINRYQEMPADFTRDPDLEYPAPAIQAAIRDSVVEDGINVVDATQLAAVLLGDTIAANLIMLGFAYQSGLLPLAATSIERAIELNGVAIEMNKNAFLWGRRAAFDGARVQALLMPEGAEAAEPRTLDELIEHRAACLVEYQNASYAQRYRERVARVRQAETERLGEGTALTEAVARNYFKVLAYKDEFEVARLYTNGAFERRLAEQFTGDYKLRFHLAPPLLAQRDPSTGLPRKHGFGSWMMPAFRLLARLKGLRGTRLDPFAYSHDRKLDVQLIADYEASLDAVTARLSEANYQTMLALVRLPEQIRGFGHVKRANYDAAMVLRESYLAALDSSRGGNRSASVSAEVC
jgi:indolepyruvate ferredoxin oxidoreductase